MSSAEKPIVFTKPESTIVRTSKLFFYLGMAAVSPLVAIAFLCFIAGFALAILGFAWLVKEVPIAAGIVCLAFLTGASAYALSGRRRLKLLMHRISFLESEITQAHGQVRELEQIISFDKQLKTEKRMKDKA